MGLIGGRRGLRCFMYRRGRIGRFGLSNFATFEAAEIVTMCKGRDLVRPTIYQAFYNAIRMAFSHIHVARSIIY